MYSNGLESHHILIKKELSECGNPKSVEKVNEILYNRIDKYYCQVEKAIRGIGEQGSHTVLYSYIVLFFEIFAQMSYIVLFIGILSYKSYICYYVCMFIV